MNLDEQLRAALNQEAEMQTRTRTRRGQADQWRPGPPAPPQRGAVGVAAAVAVVLVGGGAYGVTQIDPGPARPEPAGPTAESTTTPQAATGHRRPHDSSRAPTGCSSASTPPALRSTPTSPSTARAGAAANYPGACRRTQSTAASPSTGPSAGRRDRLRQTTAPNTDLGDTPQALAQQLAQLPQSTVLQAPTPVQAFGHDALHLRLRITNDCPAAGEALPRVAETPRGSHGISYSYDPKTVVIDFWVVDLDGVPVVVDAWHHDDASSELVDRIAQTRDSITFVTGG